MKKKNVENKRIFMNKKLFKSTSASKILDNHQRFPLWLTLTLSGILLLTSIGVVVFCAVFIRSDGNGTYKESCNVFRICNQRLGLKCINSVCDCQFDEFFMITCISRKRYSEKCNTIGNQSQCLENTNMLCLDGLCKCNQSISYWNGNKCEPKQIYNESCQSDIQCMTSQLLYCDNKLEKCLCKNDR